MYRGGFWVGDDVDDVIMFVGFVIKTGGPPLRQYVRLMLVRCTLGRSLTWLGLYAT